MGKAVEDKNNNEIVLIKKNDEDLLNREILAKNFLNVVQSQNVNVFSINGGWGTGKTWFLNFIVNEANQRENLVFVKYNVWESDYANNPFQALITELISNINDYIEKHFEVSNSKNLVEYINGIKKKGSILAKAMKNISLAPSISVSTPDGNAYTAKLDVSTTFQEDKNEYEIIKELKEKFIFDLQNIINNLNGIPLIIAIDELDRCRPDYALRTLEIIKHFFSIKGLKFILAVDKNQLANTVKALYGQNANTDCYLRKFVDIEYNLPQLSNDNLENFLTYYMTEKYPQINKVLDMKNNSDTGNIYYQEQSNKLFYQDNRMNSLNKQILSYIIESIKKSNLRLRDIEKIFLKLNIIILQVANFKFFNFTLLWNLLVMNTKYIDFYEHFKIAANEHSNIMLYLETIKTQDEYYSYLSLNPQMRLFLLGLTEKPSDDYNFYRRERQSTTQDIACYYSESFKSYFDVIDITEDFDIV